MTAIRDLTGVLRKQIADNSHRSELLTTCDAIDREADNLARVASMISAIELGWRGSEALDEFWKSATATSIAPVLSIVPPASESAWSEPVTLAAPDTAKEGA